MSERNNNHIPHGLILVAIGMTGLNGGAALSEQSAAQLARDTQAQNIEAAQHDRAAIKNADYLAYSGFAATILGLGFSVAGAASDRRRNRFEL